MPYLRAALEVEAMKYEPGKGLEDGFEMLSKVITNGWVAVERLVKITNQNGSITCPFITNKRGKIFIGENDYIIIEKDGDRHVCSEESFNLRFTKA